MICPVCQKRPAKTPGSTFCGTCYTKHWRSQNPERAKVISQGYRERNRFGGNWYRSLKRDKYHCRLCGIKGITKTLAVHHLDKLGTRVPPELQNNNLDNLITLCLKCRPEVLKLSGRGFTFEEIKRMILLQYRDKPVKVRKGKMRVYDEKPILRCTCGTSLEGENRKCFDCKTARRREAAMAWWREHQEVVHR